MARSSLIALMAFIPILASVLSFVRHSNTIDRNGFQWSSLSQQDHIRSQWP